MVKHLALHIENDLYERLVKLKAGRSWVAFLEGVASGVKVESPVKAEAVVKEEEKKVEEVKVETPVVKDWEREFMRRLHGR